MSCSSGGGSRRPTGLPARYQFPGRWQVSAGVGETVKLSVTNPNAGSLRWTDESPVPVGVLKATSPAGEAVYTAGGEPGTATLACRDGTRKEVHRHQFTILAPNGGTRAQAPPAMLAGRHGRPGSQATWSPALPLPAAVPAGYGPRVESPASDLLWRLAAGDCLMGVQLGGKVI